MKRFEKVLTMLFVGVASLVMSACQPDPFEPDPAMLEGVWKNGTEYYHYYSSAWNYEQFGGTQVSVNGNLWDTSVDEGENEALPFHWELNGDQMVQLHYDYMGAVVPKTYTVTALTDSKLSYQDKYGRIYNYTKVK